MPFFAFSQNNSGGSYDQDERSGIGEVVVVEAENANKANSRAEDLGLDFSGRYDCDCCGNRWYRQYENEKGIEFEDVLSWDWRKTVYIHTAKGKIYVLRVEKTEVTKQKEKREYEKKYGRRY